MSACSVTAGPTGDDLDTAGAEIPEEQEIVEDMFLAATTERAALPWAPEDTINIQTLLGRAGTPSDLATFGSTLESCFDRDERYLSSTANTSKPDPQSVSVKLAAETEAGSFELQLEQSPDQPMRLVRLA